MPKAIGYVRIATERGAEPGVALDAQKAQIQAYCAAQGLELAQIFEDVGSGTTMDRPGLQSALAAVGKGDVLVVCSLSRLSRNLRDTLELHRLLTKKGVALVSVTEQFDFESAAGKLTFGLAANQAEYEHNRCIEQRARARQGD